MNIYLSVAGCSLYIVSTCMYAMYVCMYVPILKVSFYQFTQVKVNFREYVTIFTNINYTI